MKFEKKAAILFGWEMTKRNFKFFAVASAITLLLNSYARLFQGGAPDKSIATWVVVVVSGVALAVLRKMIEMGVIKAAIKVVEEKKVTYSDLAFRDFRLVMYGILGDILFGVMFFVGLILLIVPGVYWAVKYQFYSYFIVEKGLGPIESLKESARITKGCMRNLLLFDLIIMAIVIVGALAFYVGIFFSLPISTLAMAYVYRKLHSGRHSE